jgi:hypothetical protein
MIIFDMSKTTDRIQHHLLGQEDTPPHTVGSRPPADTAPLSTNLKQSVMFVMTSMRVFFLTRENKKV